MYSKNGGEFPTNQTLKFDTQSNFVPIDFAKNGDFQGDASMRRLADYNFKNEPQG
jgi:hypothetical protein